MEKENSSQQLDYTLIFILFLLAIVSSIAINGAEDYIKDTNIGHINFSIKQIQWYIIGIFAVIGTMIIDFDRFKLLSWYLYGFGMLLLLGLHFHIPGAKEVKGAWGWYEIPGGLFQPSELMKIFMIIVLSRIISNHREKYPINTVRDDLLLIGKILLASAPPIYLLTEQPDMGMSMVFMAIICSLIIVSGIKWRIILTVLFIGIFMISIAVYIYFVFPDFFDEHILSGYQMERFYGWLTPHETSADEGFQLIQSLLAIGSGELDGKADPQVYIPEPHTDFIFSVIGELYGFIGASIVISLFFILIYRMIHIALESHDPFGSYLCAGVIGMITFQVFQNIGMAVGLLPITGLPLPFISYGGSSLATYMLAIGIVLNVRSRTRKFMFSND